MNVVDKTARLAMKKLSIVAIAPDSFKGALSAEGVARAIADGLAKSFPNAEFRLIPMADGGEGTVDAWAACTEAMRIKAKVQDTEERTVRYQGSGNGEEDA